jgi:integrase
MLRKAHVWKKIAEHPGTDVKPFKAASGKTRFLSEEEEATILAACPPPLRRVVEVGLLTGLRRQELAGLRPDDVDLERGTIHVAESTSKNGESRTLPMGPRLTALLQDILSRQHDAATVFLTDEGSPWTPSGLTAAFRRTTKRAGLGVMGPHIMRHTFASRLVMAGVDLRTVQELMGHKSILMTMRYAHLSPDHTRAAMETLERRFSAKSPATFPNTPHGAFPERGGKLTAVR